MIAEAVRSLAEVLAACRGLRMFKEAVRMLPLVVITSAEA
jgi:hypothetical protein